MADLTEEQLAEIERDLTVRERVSGSQSYDENLAVIRGLRSGTTIGDADRRVRAATPLLLRALRDARAENERLREFAEWLVSLDDPDDEWMLARQSVTLTAIIDRARAALADGAFF